MYPSNSNQSGVLTFAGACMILFAKSKVGSPRRRLRLYGLMEFVEAAVILASAAFHS
jgi:hypothetical protein